MNYINRPLVKQQAKDIIRDKVFVLFIITIIVAFLTGAGFNFVFKANKSPFAMFNRDKSSQSEQQEEWSNDPFSNWDNPIENFNFNSAPEAPAVTELSVTDNAKPINSFITAKLGSSTIIMMIVFAPLNVTLAGMYLSLIRRRPEEEFVLGKELCGIFKNTFNETYLKKLLLMLIKTVIMTVLFICFFFPGMIFLYSSYFTDEIMSDNPNLKPGDAIRLSKRIVRGNRSELFRLDLSFLGWFILSVITCGIAAIYALPYYRTARALYYENFRMRALQQGRVTEDDFKTFEEKIRDIANVQNNIYPQSDNYYTYVNSPQSENGYYYSPQQTPDPVPPQQPAPLQDDIYHYTPSQNDIEN